MPPPRSRVPPDDSRSETSSTREKLGTATGMAGNGKGRRATSGLGVVSSVRDNDTSRAVSTTTSVATGSGSFIGHEGSAGVSYSVRAQSSLLIIDRCNGRLSTLPSYIHIDMHTG
jgi:histone deacetylase complex subunit SAP30